jgi:Ca2+-binding EF-hand superfamily protein
LFTLNKKIFNFRREEIMVSIQNTQSISPVTYSNTGFAGTSGYNPLMASYSSDTFNSNQNLNPTVEEANKQAGFGKRFFNSVGNAFGKMADWVGLGTLSHFAKANFEAMDTNHNNSVDINEFSAVGQMIGRSFQQVDSNTDQQISLGEFKKVIGDLVDAEFKALDTSADGFLNLNEVSPAGYAPAFASHDTNQDGLLSRNEFAGLLNDLKIKKH